jgi:hypothetical protein
MHQRRLGFVAASMVFLSLPAQARDVVSVGAGGRLVEDSFFGMHVRYGASKMHWPDVRFHSWRVISPGTAWFGLQPKKEEWNFVELDRAIKVAEQHGTEVLLTLGQTPAWAAARPHEVVPNGAGASSEPAQIEDWERYIRTVARRYKGRIKHYELWNEPRFREVDPYRAVPGFTGYATQLVELGRVAKRVLAEEDPAATLISPALDGSLQRVEQWFRSGGASVASVLAHHFYVRPPERMVALYRKLKAIGQRYGVADMPIWNTESGYYVHNPEKPVVPVRPGSDDVFAKVLTPDELAAYLVRAHVLMAAAGLDRFYWYSWDIQDMGLTRSFGKTPMIGSVAYRTLLGWLRGTTVDRCVTQNDKLWTCDLRREGKVAYVVWNVDDDAIFNIPGYMSVGEIETIDGKTAPVHDRAIHVGITPLLLKSKGTAWVARH